MLSSVIRKYILPSSLKRVLVDVSKCTSITMDIEKPKLIFKDGTPYSTSVNFSSINEMMDEFFAIESVLKDLHMCKDGKCKCRS